MQCRRNESCRLLITFDKGPCAVCTRPKNSVPHTRYTMDYMVIYIWLYYMVITRLGANFHLIVYTSMAVRPIRHLYHGYAQNLPPCNIRWSSSESLSLFLSMIICKLRFQFDGTPTHPLMPRGACAFKLNGLWKCCSVHTEKSFLNLIKSTWNQIVFTIFRLIWIQTDVRLDPNQ